MKKIINTLKILQKTQPNVYTGKGAFEKFSIDFQPGLSEKKIQKKTSDICLQVPKDYAQLLQFSNGIYFFDAACRISDLDSAIKSTVYFRKEKVYGIEKDFLHIGTFYEDFIFIKCSKGERNIFISEEGIDPLRPLNMSFKAFLDASLASSFSYFWLWGTDDYDLY